MRDYYRVLRVPETAGADEIKRAYRRLARAHHPDVTDEPGAADAFREIRRAYETLSDHDRRKAYDARRASRRRLEPSRAERYDWFADEVRIEFPSVNAVLDRMRDAFFGPDDFPHPLSAEILLTPQEAFRGVVVPMHVPIRRTCPSCGGRGEIWMDRCGACAGTGAAWGRHEVQVTVPPGVRDSSRFRFSLRPPGAPPTLVEVRIAIL